MLNEYVGETERRIRQVFQRAREKAREYMPVIVFFDEMDSSLSTRVSKVSSDGSWPRCTDYPGQSPPPCLTKNPGNVRRPPLGQTRYTILTRGVIILL